MNITCLGNMIYRSQCCVIFYCVSCSLLYEQPLCMFVACWYFKKTFIYILNLKLVISPLCISMPPMGIKIKIMCIFVFHHSAIPSDYLNKIWTISPSKLCNMCLINKSNHYCSPVFGQFKGVTNFCNKVLNMV